MTATATPAPVEATSSAMVAYAANSRLSSLITEIEMGRVIVQPPFQRRSVWSTKQKKALIETILKGYPFPEVFFAHGHVDTETDTTIMYVVDGQQRLTAIYDYYKDKLPTGKDLPSFKRLSEEQRVAFMAYTVVIREIKGATQEQIQEVFQRINATSSSLNPMEVRHADYDHPLIQAAKEMIQHPYLDKIGLFGKADKRRMKDLEWGLLVLATMLDGYFDRDKGLTDAFETYNDTPEILETALNRFHKAMSWIEKQNLPEGCKAFQKPHLFTLVVEVDKADQEGKLTDKPKTKLADFYANLPKEYLEASRQGSSNKASRDKRGKELIL